MNIKFVIAKGSAYIPKGEPMRRASQRFRATVPLKGMRPTDGYIDTVKEAKSDDLIVLAKNTSVDDIMYLKNNNIKFIFDICDDKWRVGKNASENTIVMNEGCKNANLITTTCEELKEKIKKETGREAHIIPDPYEREIEKPSFNPGKHINFCYFGGRKSFSLVDWESIIKQVKDTMAKLQKTFEITVITQKPDRATKRLRYCLKCIKRNIDDKIDYINKNGFLNLYHWNWDLQGELVRRSDIVLLPVPGDNHIVKVKSPNRVIDSIIQGKYVISTYGVNSYRDYAGFIGLGNISDNIIFALNNKEVILDRIKNGQEFLIKHHSPQIIGAKWIETEKLV